MASVNLPYNFQTRDYQDPLWQAVVNPDFQRGIIVIPRRNGKDLTCWNLLPIKAFQRVGLYFYMGPFYNQIRQIIWQGTDGQGRRFLDYIPRQLVKSKTKLDMRIELVNGSQVKLCGSDNIDSIVGTNPIGIVFTEFSLHKPESWDYLRPILAENGGWALFNGTPRGLNHFYQLAEYAKGNPNWFHQHLTRDDTSIPSLEAIEEDRRSGMPESLIQQEYYCKWTASSEEVLIPLDIVEPALTTKIKEEDFSFKPRIMGVDVAYAAKGDQAVIAKRQGRYLHPLLKFQGLDNMSFATRVVREIVDWNPDAVFIDSGRGEGVIHRLIQLGYGHLVLPVHFSGKPYSDLYLNKRAEIWGRYKDWFLRDNKPLIPNDEDLIASTCAPTFWQTDRGFIQLEAKRSVKKRLSGRSPDDADAVALTFAEHVDPGPLTIDRNLPIDEQQVLAELLRMRESAQADNNYNVLEHFNGDEYDEIFTSFNEEP